MSEIKQEEKKTLDDEHKIEYKDVVLECYTPEIYIILLTNFAPIHLI